MVLVVRFDIRNEEEERIVLVRVHIADHGVGLCVDAVTGHFHRFAVVVVHHHVVGVRREFEQIRGQPVVVAAPLFLTHRTGAFVVGQVPLANVAGGVTGVLEVVGQGTQVRGQGDAIAKAACLCGVQAGLQARARRPTHRLDGERIVDVCATLGHAIEIGGQIQRVAVHAGGVPALLIGEEDDHVG